VGQDAPLRIIRHRFDLAATHQGRLLWRVKAGVVTQLRGRYGLGAEAEAVTVFPEPALRLIHLQEDGALARLGFREGDLLFSVNGKRLAPGELGTLADQLAAPGSAVHVKVFREASLQDLTFVVEGL
jgi:hypothetical protein